MSVAVKAEPENAGKGMSDAEVVEAYLTASMIPDPDAAAASGSGIMEAVR